MSEPTIISTDKGNRPLLSSTEGNVFLGPVMPVIKKPSTPASLINSEVTQAASIEGVLNLRNYIHGDKTSVPKCDVIYLLVPAWESTPISTDTAPASAYYYDNLQTLLNERPETYTGLYTPYDLSSPTTFLDMALLHYSELSPVEKNEVFQSQGELLTQFMSEGLRLVAVRDSQAQGTLSLDILSYSREGARTYTAWLQGILEGSRGLPLPFALALLTYEGTQHNIHSYTDLLNYVIREVSISDLKKVVDSK